MLPKPDILIFSGSIRAGSRNALLAEAVAKAVSERGGKANLVSLRDYPMPIYDGDLEQQTGAPAAAVEFARLMTRHDGIIILSPEYNASIPPLLKNTLDWVSRVKAEEGELLSPFKKPVFALGGASPGALGTLRNLAAMRLMLEMGFGALVIPEQLGVPQSGSAFDEEGRLIAERPLGMMERLVSSLVSKATVMREAGGNG